MVCGCGVVDVGMVVIRIISLNGLVRMNYVQLDVAIAVNNFEEIIDLIVLSLNFEVLTLLRNIF